MVEIAISTNQKPTIYRNLYENTGPEQQHIRNSFPQAALRVPLDACVYQLTTKFHVKSTRCGHTSAASTDCLPNAGPTASTCGPMPWEPSSYLGMRKVCLGFPRIHRNIEEKYLFLIFENSEKNKTLICEKHYLIFKIKN